MTKVKAESTGLNPVELRVRSKMFQAKAPDPEVVTITPEEAWFILENHNGFNRPVNWDVVHFYKSQMERGLWQVNGEAIIISDTGELLDGQHRLYACYEAKIPFKTIMVKGISKEAFKTIDQGKKRSASDVIAIDKRYKGEVSGHTTTLASAAGICLEYYRGWIKKKGTGGAKVSPMEKLQFTLDYPALSEWVEMARSERGVKQVIGHSSVIAAICFIGGMSYEMKAKTFLKGVLSGEMLAGKDPMLALQRKFIENERLRLHRWEKIAYTISAWNKHVDNEKIMVLKLPQDEQIPDIKGAKKLKV